jgi:hypothetical protein
LARVKEHTPGTVRYFTHRLEFPDGDEWVDQVPFVHDLQFELKKTRWYKHDAGIYRDLLTKGQAKWTDHNGVKNWVIIETVQRPRVWGTKKGKMQ